MSRITVTTTVTAPCLIVDLLAAETDLSKGRIKDAMAKGALWLKPKTGKGRRLRKAKAKARPGDRLEFHYDPDILALVPVKAKLIDDQGRFSVWDKPAGLLSQGTRQGDHCSLLRQVEHYFHGKRQVFLIHRLDREASGLIVVAHDKQAAAQLSTLFTTRQVDKHYHIEVLGDLQLRGSQGVIDLDLDGQQAISLYQQTSYAPETDSSTVRVTIKTGRKHQIRRHFEAIGHPVIGDPRYGTGNKGNKTMQLRAVELAFTSPFSGKQLNYRLLTGPDL